MADQEIKPCPFCGGDNIWVESIDIKIWFCYCCDCIAEGPNAEDAIKAIDKWNRRVK